MKWFGKIASEVILNTGDMILIHLFWKHLWRMEKAYFDVIAR